MDIRNRSALKQDAAAALRGAQQEKRIISVYVGITIALSVVMLIADTLLNRAVSGTGGLSNLGTRTILQLVQTLLPIAQMLFLLCWDMGYLRSVLNMSRGKEATCRTLTAEFGIFGPTLRLNLLLGFYFGLIGAVCFYLGMQVYLLTPLAAPLIQIIELSAGSMLSSEMVLTDAVMDATMDAMPLMLAIGMIFFAILALPMVYRYRMAYYCLLEKPRAGALAAMRESTRMMRGKQLQLLKLDLSLWWYFLLEGLVTAVCYGDVLLPLLGISLPFSPTVSYYLFYGAYLVLLFILSYCLRNYKELIYAKAYDALRPPETPNNGVVLGNIFQM